MIKGREYDEIALALRTALPRYEDRLRVFKVVNPVLTKQNPRYKPQRFGERLFLKDSDIKRVVRTT